MEDIRKIIDNNNIVIVDKDGEHVKELSSYLNLSIEEILKGLNRYPDDLINIYQKTKKVKFLNDISLAIITSYLYSENNARKKRLENLDEAYGKLRESYATLKESYDKFEKINQEYSDLEDKVNYLKSQIEEKGGTIQELIEERNKLNDNLEKEKELTSELMKKNKELDEKLEFASKTADEFETQKSSLESNLNDAEKKIQKLNDDLASLGDENSKLKSVTDSKYEKLKKDILALVGIQNDSDDEHAKKVTTENSEVKVSVEEDHVANVTSVKRENFRNHDLGINI